jgi:hypothetical protein
MSCPDWRNLDAAARETAAWDNALRHLDGGCAACWRDALAVDPTLVFRRLPVPELSPAAEADEVAATRLAVAAMRTASRAERGTLGDRLPELASSAFPARAGRLLRLQSARSPQIARWSLAASLTLMALVFGSSHGWRNTGAGMHAAAVHGITVAAAAASPGFAPSSSTISSSSSSTLVRPLTGQAARRWGSYPAGDTLPAASRSSIDGLSQPDARVYQLDGPHMSVVMIVDEKLDV